MKFYQELYLKKRQLFNLTVMLNEFVQPDFLIIKFDLIVLNETNAEKCKAKISVIKEDEPDILNRYSLEIDTTSFCSNQTINPDDLDVSCMIHIHYTNMSGSEQNLCYKLKTKLIIKFMQVVTMSLMNIQDLE